MKFIVKLYAYLHEFFHVYFDINIPGLGFLFRKIKKDFFIDVKGYKLYFNHKVADSYIRLINGRFNEPETHNFLDFVFNNCGNKNFHFIEVGGNVGEYLIDYSSNPNVKKVTIFEPQPELVKTLNKTIIKNNFNNTTLIAKPVSNLVEIVYFDFDLKNSNAKGISNTGTEIMATTLDVEIEISNFDFVVLIDVEGAELKVFEGCKDLIDDKKPLFIFEYNYVTKKYFKLEDLEVFLGENYEIYRINRRGGLDKEFEDTWNLAAIPKNHLYTRLNELIN